MKNNKDACVVQVCAGYPPDRIGGIENIVQALHTFLMRSSYSSYVITRRWKGYVSENQVIQLDTPKAEALGYLIWCVKALLMIRRLKPRIVHCHGLEGAIICLLLYPSKIKKVMHLHNAISREVGYRSKPSHLIGLQILKLSMKAARLVICPTKAARDDLISNTAPYMFRKTVVIPNFCRDPSQISNKEIQVTRQKLGVEDKKIILYFGKIKSTKGIEDICKAYNLMGHKSQVSLVLAGMGTATNRFFMKLKKLYPDVILTGYVDNPSIFYRMADAFCIYTDSFAGGETFAMSLADAMLHQVPIIASDNIIYKEVTNGNAVFVPSNDPLSLAKAFDFVLQNKEKISYQIARAKLFAEEKYAKHRFLAKMDVTYQWLLGQ
ncbi:MAG: glycosyltransferase family 4 protein [Conexivisphaerales archaeon]